LLRPAAAVGRLMRLTAGSRTWDGGREGGGVSGARLLLPSVECLACGRDGGHVLGGPGQQHVDGVAQCLAQRRDPVSDRHRAGGDDLAFDYAVAFESPERRGQRLLRDLRGGTAQLVETDRKST